jgi:MFS family permease
VSAWRGRNFRLLLFGRTVSSFGNTLVPVALAFAVLDLTGSASDLGYVLGAQATALVVFMLVGGVIADRLSRRALMVGADAVRGCAQLVLGLLLVTGHPSVPTLAGLGAVVGMAAAVYMPASTGLLPALVKPEDLRQANVLQQTSSAAAGVAGPAAAGVFVVTVGPGWAIIADAGTFFVSVATLALIQFSHVPRGKGRNWFRDLHDGWKDFWTRRWFRDVVVGFSAYNLLFAMYTVLGPAMSRRYYGGAAAWATIATASAVGSVLAGLVATRLRPQHPLRLALPVAMLGCLAPLGFATLAPLPVLATAGALGGAGLLVFESLWQTSVQRHVPE